MFIVLIGMQQHELQTFKHVVKNISPVTDEDWHLLEHSIEEKTIAKHVFLQKQEPFCSTIGFIPEGTFRTYYFDKIRTDHGRTSLYSLAKEISEFTFSNGRKALSGTQVDLC